MKHPGMNKAVEKVLSGTPITAAAKEYGIPVSSLRVKVLTHPNYEAAKAQGLLHERKGPVEALYTNEQLREHPAVVAVVSGGLTYNAAGVKFNIAPTTINRWVHRAYPDFESPAERGGRGAAAGNREQGSVENHQLSDPLLLEMIRAAAKQKGVDPRMLCAGLLNHFKAEA